MRRKIMKAVSILIFCVAMNIPIAQAQNMPVMGQPAGDAITGLISFSTDFMSDPSSLNVMLGLTSFAVGTVSPGLGMIIEGDFDDVQDAIVEGRFFLSPSITLVPGIPLINRPLSGLEGMQ